MDTQLIGTKITQARKKMGLSQAQLAQQVFVSPQAVGKWERGESLPDIVTLNRLAILLGVDLNYFAEGLPSSPAERPAEAVVAPSLVETPNDPPKAKPTWDMSKANWTDADFSGLGNLHEKLKSSNFSNCKFVCSDLSGLHMGSNNVQGCDFTGSHLQESYVQHSNLEGDRFVECSLVGTHFSSTNISHCDFTRADLSGGLITLCSLQHVDFSHAVLSGTAFKLSSLTDVHFEGTLQDCAFENCSYGRVTFENATLLNTFFKGRSLRRVQFINCEADRLTYEFLKNGKADVSGVRVISTEVV